MSSPICFKLQLAGLIFEISCLYESTRNMCRDYLARDTFPSDWKIVINEQSLAREQSMLYLKGDPGANNPAIVESYSLCRYLAEYLPLNNRVLFHGSSLAIDGNGVLFTAKSGTGKSTHTRLWRQVFGDRVTMINDDKPFLHIRPDGTTVYGTPWRGKHGLGSNISAPLRAICIVCRSKENRIEPVSHREALPMLLQQTYSPDAPEKLVKTLALADLLSKTIPVYRLYCNMEPEAAEVAYAGINLA